MEMFRNLIADFYNNQYKSIKNALKKFINLDLKRNMKWHLMRKNMLICIYHNKISPDINQFYEWVKSTKIKSHHL